VADNSLIEWTEATWNPVVGCSVISPGCTNCYAMTLAGGRLKTHPTRIGLTRASKAGPVWTGEVRFNERELLKPLQWTRGRLIFVCAHGDLFHENVPDAWIDQVFAVMALSPQHTFQVLTKRSARMRAYVSQLDEWALEDAEVWRAAAHRVACDDDPNGSRAWHKETARLESALTNARAILSARKPLPNVWLGVSAEDQVRADQRIPDLIATPATVRFVSAEPLIGPISFADRWIEHPDSRVHLNWLDALHWLIAGGESGLGARPMHPAWPRQLRDECAATEVAFFFKQWGGWQAVEAVEGSTQGFVYMAEDGVRDAELRRRESAQGSVDWTAWWFEQVGKRVAGRELDGRTWDAMPARVAA
jgi:protein gp37